MIEPDDFELSPIATLAHIATFGASPAFAQCWTHWRQRVAEAPARLNQFRGPSPDSTDGSGTHWIESIGHVRISCRLIEPPRGTAVRAGLVALHAYRDVIPLSGEDEVWEDLARRGVLIAAVRLRGFAGSRIDCADFTQDAAGWIGRGIAMTIRKPQDAMDWSLIQGVADAACAMRAMRVELDRRAPAGADAPLMLHGRSFGGGIAVMAAAQAPESSGMDCRVSRLAIGHPSLGDWLWRIRRGDRGAGTGAGADVRRALVAHAAREEELVQTLALGDAAAHARRVDAPTLCMLALRDDTVPAPTAAAVFNALATDPGLRWRFLAPYGHFDGGIRNARRHALFERCLIDFLDPSRPVGDAMADWEGVLESGDHGPEREAAPARARSLPPSPGQQ